MSQDFKLIIHMGNDAMRTPEDISNALEEAAVAIFQGRDYPALAVSGTIRDGNGNTVGHYHIEEK